MERLWKARWRGRHGVRCAGRLQPFLSPRGQRPSRPCAPGRGRCWWPPFPTTPGQRRGTSPSTAGGRTITGDPAPAGAGVPGLMERHPGHAFVPGADSSPVPELAAAELAGVGFRGRHGLRIVPPYGSYVFLGTVLTDLALPATGPRRGDPLPPKTAGPASRPAPPGPWGRGGCQVTRCLSHWSQEEGGPAPGDGPGPSGQPHRLGVWTGARPPAPTTRGRPSPPCRSSGRTCCPPSPPGPGGAEQQGLPPDLRPPGLRLAGIAPLRRNLALQGEGLSPTPQKKPPAPDENRRSG